MSQLVIRFLFLNVYLFALLCPSGELAVVRNHAKWPISQSLLKTALFDFFSFKKTTPELPIRKSTSNKTPKNEAVASKVSTKQKSFRSLLLWWPRVQTDVADLPTLPAVLASLTPLATPLLPSPLELFEILTI